MSESRPNKAVTDEELIGVLTAISVVSRRLARKLIQLKSGVWRCFLTDWVNLIIILLSCRKLD